MTQLIVIGIIAVCLATADAYQAPSWACSPAPRMLNPLCPAPVNGDSRCSLMSCPADAGCATESCNAVQGQVAADTSLVLDAWLQRGTACIRSTWTLSECCSLCSSTDGCNAWSYCNNPAGCGTDCSADSHDFRFNRALSLWSVNPTDYPSRRNPEHKCLKDGRWPYNTCSLKVVSAHVDVAEPPLVPGSESSGWVSGVLGNASSSDLVPTGQSTTNLAVPEDDPAAVDVAEEQAVPADGPAKQPPEQTAAATEQQQEQQQQEQEQTVPADHTAQQQKQQENEEPPQQQKQPKKQQEQQQKLQQQQQLQQLQLQDQHAEEQLEQQQQREQQEQTNSELHDQQQEQLSTAAPTALIRTGQQAAEQHNNQQPKAQETATQQQQQQPPLQQPPWSPQLMNGHEMDSAVATALASNPQSRVTPQGPASNPTIVPAADAADATAGFESAASTLETPTGSTSNRIDISTGQMKIVRDEGPSRPVRSLTTNAARTVSDSGAVWIAAAAGSVALLATLL